EVLRSQALAGTWVVVLAQAFAGDGADHAVGQVLGLSLVAEPPHSQPGHPGGVDPGWPAPVTADWAVAAVGLVARLRGRDRGRGDRGEELVRVQQVLLDQAAADRLRQVR